MPQYIKIIWWIIGLAFIFGLLFAAFIAWLFAGDDSEDMFRPKGRSY